MQTSFRKIMLVTNKPSDARGAEQTAVNIAKANDASILIVDSIRTPFHAPRFPSLKTELIYETALTAKNVYLNELQGKFAQEGVKAESRVLFSPRTSSELISTVVEEECDLVIRYLKGQTSKSEGRYGETAENLLRACPVPVLLVDKPVAEPRVLACLNLDHGAEENQAILDNARRLAPSPSNLFVLSCWEYSGHDFMLDYMDEGLHEQSKQEAAELYGKLFDRVTSEYELGDLDDQVHLKNENPATAIPTFCTENEIDVVVMCSASLNHPLGRQLGSTIERTIGKLPCGLMTVKPIGFRSAGANTTVATSHSV